VKWLNSGDIVVKRRGAKRRHIQTIRRGAKRRHIQIIRRRGGKRRHIQISTIFVY